MKRNYYPQIIKYSFAFLIIVLLGYIPLWKNNFSIIWDIDGIGQYFPAFLYIGQYIRNFFTGIFKGALVLPFYDLSIGMGEDIIGTLNYYGFGDPVNLLAVFANQKTGTYLFTVCFFLRIWGAGLSFQLYCHEVEINRVPSIIASLCYAFCGFAIYGGGRYIEWLSVLIYFPLLLYGTEKVFRGKRLSIALILATAYGSLCGFYFLYMASLCLGIYWIVRLIFGEKAKKIKKFILMGRCIFNYLLGLGLSAPVFLLSISSYLYSERAGTDIMQVLFDLGKYKPTLNWEFIAVETDFWHNRNSNLSGILVVELVAVVSIFFIRGRKALQMKLAVVILLLFLHLPIIGWIFNGFGETNDRWVFCVHFLFALIFAYIYTII